MSKYRVVVTEIPAITDCSVPPPPENQVFTQVVENLDLRALFGAVNKKVRIRRPSKKIRLDPSE